MLESSPQGEQVWIARHAPGRNKPAEYIRTQGAEATLRYNEELQRFFEARARGEGRPRVPVFETYNLTVEATSFDGSHYGQQASLLGGRLGRRFCGRLSPRRTQSPATELIRRCEGMLARYRYHHRNSDEHPLNLTNGDCAKAVL